MTTRCTSYASYLSKHKAGLPPPVSAASTPELRTATGLPSGTSPPRPGTESRFWDARGPGTPPGELGPRASPNRATVLEPGSVLGRGWYWNAPGAGTRERYWNAELVLERGGGTGTPPVLERGNGTGTRNWSWNAGWYWNAPGAETRGRYWNAKLVLERGAVLETGSGTPPVLLLERAPPNPAQQHRPVLPVTLGVRYVSSVHVSKTWADTQ